MKRRQSKITIFAIVTTATIIIWVLAEAYQRIKKTEFTAIPEHILAPIAPSLDKETLDNMEKRLWFSESEFSGPPPLVLEEVKKEASPSSEASPSGGR